MIEELATMRFLENEENIVFLGPPGMARLIWLQRSGWWPHGTVFLPITSTATL